MKNSNIFKLIYNKNNFIKLLILCILGYVIYFLYSRIDRMNEGFVITSPETASPQTVTYTANENGT